MKRKKTKQKYCRKSGYYFKFATLIITGAAILSLVYLKFINESFEKNVFYRYNFGKNFNEAVILAHTSMSSFDNQVAQFKENPTNNRSFLATSIHFQHFDNKRCLVIENPNLAYATVRFSDLTDIYSFEASLYINSPINANTRSKTAIEISHYDNLDFYLIALSYLPLNPAGEKKILEFSMGNRSTKISTVSRQFPIEFPIEEWFNIEFEIIDNYIHLKIIEKNVKIRSEVDLSMEKLKMGLSVFNGLVYFSDMKINNFPANMTKIENSTKIHQMAKLIGANETDFIEGNNKNICARILIDNKYYNAISAFPISSYKFNIKLPENPYLRFSYGISKEGWNIDAGVNFLIYITDKENNIQKVFSDFVNPFKNISQREWFKKDISLQKFAGQQIEITLETRSKKNYEQMDFSDVNLSFWVDPEIYNKAYINKDNPNIILIALDALRPDHLGLYGYKERNTSPFLDQFAKEGVVFDKAISQASFTIPSFYSTFSSRYPAIGYAYEWDEILDNTIPFFTQILSKNDYYTAAFTGGGFVSGRLGFFRGFDIYSNGKPKIEEFDKDLSGESINDVKKWIREYGKNKFFLFFHTYEIHSGKMHDQFLRKGLKEKVDLTFEEIKEKDIAIYDSGILYADNYVKRIVDILKEQNILDNTMIIIMADHGEELYDNRANQFRTHGGSLNYNLLKIPLIVIYKDKIQPGKRVNKVTRLIDLAPTILDYAGIDIPEDYLGVSLRPYLEDDMNEKDLELIAYSNGVHAGPDRISIIKDKYHYIFIPNKTDEELKTVEDKPNTRELYDIENDPSEKINLAKQQPELAKYFQKMIDNYMSNSAVVDSRATEISNVGLSPDEIQKLRALGYIK